MPIQYIVFYLKRFKIECSVLLLILAMVSCRRQSEENFSHPEYFDKVFYKAEKLQKSKPELALPFLDSAFSVFPNPGVKDLFKYYRFKDTYFVEIEKDYAMGKLYNDSALWVIRKFQNDKDFANEYADGLFNKGYLLVQQKKYSEAFAADIEAMQVTGQDRNSCSVYNYYIALGWICNLQGRYLEAARYTKAGLAEMPKCNTEEYGRLTAIIHKSDDVGIYYSRIGMQDSAIYFFNSALDTLKKLGQKYNGSMADNGRFLTVYNGVIKGNMGTSYYKKGDTAVAEKLFKESIQINDHPGFDQGDSQYTLAKLASLYLSKNQLDDAGPVIRRLGQSLTELPDKAKDRQIKYYRLNLEYLGRIGRAKEAVQFSKLYLSLEDSLAAIKPIPQLDVNGEYRNQYKLAIAEKESQLKTSYLWGIFIFLLLAIIILVVIISSLRHSRKLIKQLKGLNAQISDDIIQKQTTLIALEQSHADNTKMMQIVAHDLRTPISGITSLAMLMLDDQDRTEDDLVKLELIKTNGKNSLHLVSDLLKVHAQAEELQKETVDLYLMLKYCVEQLNFKAEAKKQYIELQANPVMVSVSRQKMWRVISNLIANAVKFSPSGASILVKMEEKVQDVLISVRDHGIGIPLEIKDRIFEMFTDAKRTGTAGEQPFGLGLAISKQIVEAHGGKIWFENNVGNGTTFYIELPKI